MNDEIDDLTRGVEGYCVTMFISSVAREKIEFLRGEKRGKRRKKACKALTRRLLPPRFREMAMPARARRELSSLARFLCFVLCER